MYMHIIGVSHKYKSAADSTRSEYSHVPLLPKSHSNMEAI